MKSKLIVIMCVLFLPTIILGGEKLAWYTKVDIYSDSEGLEEAWHIHRLSGVNKKYVLTGVTEIVTTGYAGRSVFFMMLDSSGVEVPVSRKYYGDSNADHDYQGYELHPLDPDGDNYIFIGRTNKNGYDQLLLMKLDSDFDPVWAKLYGSAETQMVGFSVQKAEDGGYIVAGLARYYTSGITNNSQTDALLLKTDSDGDAITGWPKFYDSDDDMDVFKSIRTLKDGSGDVTGYIASGYARNEDQFDIYVVQTDTDGDSSSSVGGFNKLIGIGTTGDFALGMKQDGSSGFILSGTRSDRNGLISGHFLRIDNDGDTLAYLPIGDESLLYATMHSIMRDATTGDAILVGSAYPAVLSNVNTLIARIDDSDNILYEREITGAGADYGYWIQPTWDDGFVTCGTSYTGASPVNNPSIIAMKFTPAVCGDANESGSVTIADILFLVGCKSGCDPPEDWDLANADGSCDATTPPSSTEIQADIDYLVAYIFSSGPEPICPWCIE